MNLRQIWLFGDAYLQQVFLGTYDKQALHNSMIY